MASSPSNSRKVRFSLPGSETVPPPPTQVQLMPIRPTTVRRTLSYERSIQSSEDRFKVHGTTTYVNGTLVKFIPEQQFEVPAVQIKPKPRPEPVTKISLKPCLKETAKNYDDLARDSKTKRGSIFNIKKISDIDRSTNSQVKEQSQKFFLGQSSSAKLLQTRSQKPTTTKFGAKRKLINLDLLKLPDLLKVHSQPQFTDTEEMIHSDDEIVNDFQDFDLSDHETERIQHELRTLPNMDKILISPEENLSTFYNAANNFETRQKKSGKGPHFQLSKFLRISSSRKETKFPPTRHRFIKSQNPTTTKYRTKIMSLQKVPIVTTLLRASRDADEVLLSEVLTEIISNGLSSENLNATDNSGRTALSYVCSTNLTNILDVLLQLPGIDINKSDNEGNTPLHFAAQAGQSEIMNTLITKCRSLQVDAKNNMGLTPLMKAALQGRIRCAKLLLFAGASPVEVDSTRRMRADEWSRLCGRYSCAEMIEQCSRARLLENNTSAKWARDVLANEKNKNNKGNTQLPNGGGLRSKFGRVFPFKLSFKQSKNRLITKDNSETNLKSPDGFKDKFLPKIHDKQNLNSYTGALVKVPKLEVTLASNKNLVKRYEEFSIKDDNNYSFSDSPNMASNRKIYK